MHRSCTLLLLLLLATGGCASLPRPSPQASLFDRLRAECGRAFEGRIVSAPVAPDAMFAGQRLVMHVRECGPDEIRVPFHVGTDRSRTWVVSRTANGLRLKHDHRHEDGSEDRITQYGGDNAPGGTSERQAFPADAFTRALLVREGNVAGAGNVWALELRPGATFIYELRRPGRHFRIEFDLSRAIAAPPPPWGAISR